MLYVRVGACVLAHCERVRKSAVFLIARLDNDDSNDNDNDNVAADTVTANAVDDAPSLATVIDVFTPRVSYAPTSDATTT